MVSEVKVGETVDVIDGVNVGVLDGLDEVVIDSTPSDAKHNDSGNV